MSEDTLTHLVAELLVAIRMLSGYPVPVPESTPTVYRLPQKQLEARVCNGRPCGVRGFYLKGEGIFIDEALDLEHNLKAKSILLHELVHHVQGVSGKFAGMPECHGWYAKEYEAYAIQNKYLRWERSSVNFYMDAGWRDCTNEMDD